MEASEVGRYGTLRLLKRLEDEVVASYPVDDDEISIGRDPRCSIRLYYDSVSALHCKIIFQERKAFLVVLGTNGLLIDGCAVFPSPNPSSGPVTVPLTNNSTIEIHKKRFQFCYPPKELRPILLATPSRPGDAESDNNNNNKHRRRTLRMSMIHSAQVFSPRPSQNPQENLRILQTPMKTPFRSNRRESSPLKRGVITAEEDADEGPAEEEIVLVETNHPRVVEEEQDLVIMEHVKVQEPPPEPPRHPIQFPLPQSAIPPPHMQQTPRRKPRGRPSLHRAVLIRSAQKAAAMVREIEAQDAEEVEETINEVAEEEEQSGDQPMDVDNGEQSDHGPVVSGWRKSLSAVKDGFPWPFRSSSVPRDVQEEDDLSEEQQEQSAESEQETELVRAGEDDDSQELFEFYDNTPKASSSAEDGQHPSSSTEIDRPIPAPVFNAPAPPLGKFMTPQMSGKGRGLGSAVGAGRYSMGGFTAGNAKFNVSVNLGASIGPRRVKVEQPWRVQDLVVPSTDERKDEVKEEEADELPEMAPLVVQKRPKLSEEEKNAIKERRRSALAMPDTFSPGTRRLSGFPSPIKRAPIPALNLTPNSSSSHSSSNSSSSGYDSIKEERREEEEEEEDAEVLLARMRQMVEGVKQRKSMGTAPRPSLGFVSPRKPGAFSLLAQQQEKDGESSNTGGTPGKDVATEEEDVNMEEEDITSAHASSSSTFDNHERAAQLGLATPSFKGVRELFRPPQAPPQTPNMTGVREMFRYERHPVQATPVFEGVGEMLATPAGYRGPAAREEKEEEGHMQEDVEGNENIPPADQEAQQEKEIEEEPQPPSQPPSRPPSRLRQPATTSRLPARRAGSSTAAATVTKSAPARASRVRTPEEPRPDTETAQTKTGASRVSRKPPSRSKAVAGGEDAPATRSTRARGVPKGNDEHKRANSAPGTTSSHPEHAEAEEAEEMPPLPATTAPTATRRTRKAASVEPPSAPPPSKTKATRSTRRTPAPEDPAPAPTTAGKTRSKTPTATTKRGTRGKAPPVSEEEQDDDGGEDDDELDSIPREPELEPEPEKKGTRVVRRSARTKVKEEDDEADQNLLADPPAPAPTAKRATRGKAAATTTASKTASKSTPATNGRGTTGRAKPSSSSKKAPAQPPQGESEEEMDDKENTPEPDEEEDVPAVATGTGRKATTRSGGKLNSKSKEGEPVGASRVSRAKGKTGARR